MTRSTWLKIHRTIGIIVVIQLIASFASALVFAVRSSIRHSKAAETKSSAVPMPPGFGLREAIATSAIAQPTSAKLWHAGSQPIYEIAGDSGEMAVLDGLSGARLNSADETQALQFMAWTLGQPVDRIPPPERIVTRNVTHLRGELPVWRFRTSDGMHYYVSMKNGKVVTSADRMARLSHYAYHYLHTMRFTDSDFINSLIPIPYILASLSLCSLGIYLFFSRKFN